MALIEGAYEWTVIPWDVARGIEWIWQCERQLGNPVLVEGELPDEAEEAFLTAYGRMAGPKPSSARNLKRVADIGMQARALRAGALIVHAAVHESRGLPVGPGEVESRWPKALAASGPGDPGLLYRRLSPSRFVVAAGDTDAAPDPGPGVELDGFARFCRFLDTGCEFRLTEWMLPPHPAGWPRGTSN